MFWVERLELSALGWTFWAVQRQESIDQHMHGSWEYRYRVGRIDIGVGSIDME